MPNLKLMQPQEVEVLYIMPALRREFTKELKRNGCEQKRIAELLCVTESAVSQYLNSKRASKIAFDTATMKLIKESVARMDSPNSMIKETQLLLKKLRDNGLTCKVHKNLAKLPDDCEFCDC